MFPSVVKAGFGMAGNTARALCSSAGARRLLQYPLGLFRLPARHAGALGHHHVHDAGGARQFRATAGWKIGADASVAIITVGVGGSIDTDKITSPVIGFILDPEGLMYNLTLEGSKISRIDR